MQDTDKTKRQLLDELVKLRRRVKKLEKNEANRKQTEKFKVKKELTEAALNAQRDTFFIFNPRTGRVIRWNKAFNEISGYSDEEIRSLKASDSY